MKRFKQLSVAIVVLAMCALLGISVWAANWLDVTYTATFDKPTLCITGADQTVTLTVKVSAKVDMDAFTAQVNVPEGLELDSISFGDLENAFYETNGAIMWWSASADDVINDLIADVTIKVPASANGTYDIGFEIIDISSDYGVVWETGETLAATLTVADHSYTTKASAKQATAANCENAATYYVQCDNCGAVSAEKTVAVGEAKGHDYQFKDYTVTDETHTANYICKNDGTHTKSDDPVEHTYDQEGDKCVCGAEKPATGLKGDVDLDGDVDIDDLTYLAEHVAKIITITNATSLDNAEVTGDGAVTIDDLTKLAEYVAKIIPSLD